jgi:hypothetical protein
MISVDHYSLNLLFLIILWKFTYNCVRNIMHVSLKLGGFHPLIGNAYGGSGVGPPGRVSTFLGKLVEEDQYSLRNFYCNMISPVL